MPTVNLQALGYTLATAPNSISTNVAREFVVCNGSNSPGNGGACCLWTVPSGVYWVTFEMWGGGGGGSGACCCMGGGGGGSGGYAVKTVCSSTGLAGCQYSICAAQTSCVTPGAGAKSGYRGCVSYVTGYGLSNFCAEGGSSGDAICFWGFGCYTCCSMTPCCTTAIGGDVCIPGYMGSAQQSYFCGAYALAYTPTAAATISGPLIGANGCNVWGCGNNLPPVPGMGGWSATVYGGGCCCGVWGGGGLVAVKYG
jgi:hypothetical protein